MSQVEMETERREGLMNNHISRTKVTNKSEGVTEHRQLELNQDNKQMAKGKLKQHKAQQLTKEKDILDTNIYDISDL